MKDNNWDKIKQQLKNEISEDSYNEWFSGTKQVDEDKNSITVRLVEEYADTIIREHYNDTIEKIKQQLKLDKDILFVYKSETDVKEKKNVTKKTSSKKVFSRPKFKKSYTFDSFVVGPSNELAHATSIAVTNNPGSSYNPLFIYGGTGLGKTHLLHAIGHSLLDKYPEKKIIYVSADKFTSDFVSSFRTGNVDNFKEKYRSADVLLVDDVHSLAGKTQTMEEFFNTFNHLFEMQKQIVLTSDSLPQEISRLEERLMSRFMWGLIADIKPPNLETRMAILQKKAEQEKVELPDEVTFFIAKRIRKNVRELEGALNKFIAMAKLKGSKMSVEIAKDCLSTYISEDDEYITPKKIIEYVAGYYKIAPSRLKEKGNKKQIVIPRQIAMYLCKMLTDKSFPEIGKEFGNKHHTTVIYACKQVEKKMQEDLKFNRLVESFLSSIR
jgi:chromosomal replication initiator protein